jgi:DNA-binding transcriptional regulator YiaG
MPDVCGRCGEIFHEIIGNYKYTESGLSNVWLENVPVKQCACRGVAGSIFRLRRLHELIARKLIEKPVLLEGKEIRFLRENLFLSSKAFSEKLGVGITTLSKWENNSQRHSPTNDRLIRAMYSILKGSTKRFQRIVRGLPKNPEEPENKWIMIAEKVGDDYIVRWQLLFEGSAIRLPHIFVSNKERSAKAMWRSQVFFAERGTVRGKKFSSNEFMKVSAGREYGSFGLET